MTMEHRCGQRRSISTVVVIRTTNGLAGKALTCDISASGARVRTPLPVPVYGQVWLRFLDLSRGGGRSHGVISGEIVRHTTDGFAIEWSEFSPAVVGALLRNGAVEAQESDVVATAYG